MTSQKIKVIIVDDDKFLLNMYSTKFGKAGLEVKTAQRGEEALRVLADDKYLPDIIILDIIMPGMNGLDLLAKIRQMGLVKDSTVIVLTNQGQPSDISKAEELGVQGYIVKATTIPSEVVDEAISIYKKNSEQK